MSKRPEARESTTRPDPLTTIWEDQLTAAADFFTHQQEVLGYTGERKSDPDAPYPTSRVMCFTGMPGTGLRYLRRLIKASVPQPKNVRWFDTNHSGNATIPYLDYYSYDKITSSCINSEAGPKTLVVVDITWLLRDFSFTDTRRKCLYDLNRMVAQDPRVMLVSFTSSDPRLSDNYTLRMHRTEVHIEPLSLEQTALQVGSKALAEAIHPLTGGLAGLNSAIAKEIKHKSYGPDNPWRMARTAVNTIISDVYLHNYGHRYPDLNFLHACAGVDELYTREKRVDPIVRSLAVVTLARTQPKAQALAGPDEGLIPFLGPFLRFRPDVNDARAEIHPAVRTCVLGCGQQLDPERTRLYQEIIKDRLSPEQAMVLAKTRGMSPEGRILFGNDAFDYSTWYDHFDPDET